ncbi:SMI1/KNR4 family protein [Exilibacterium tricleocarpae]|uniref:SMI1/KNR4 family protein n=1 Tax=Exilibacterium tricleocarpae TaxID=2591008 RepID=A0A545T5Q6_9GAMM|nr:SMI1/KNR4 family protein [Exilibacterium tricleocarpae]TQV72566.1 SMI1/KNR4 family protein [Exilibacterium tricleocarpae]
MKSLCNQIEKILLEPMKVPDAFVKLFEWIEKNGFYEDTEHGRVGYLYPINELRAQWGDTERPGGTLVEFYAEKNSDLFYFMNENTKGRLRVFARTGGDGSMAAFWIDDHGQQKIVHIGSGSGSMLACVLCDDPLDFLRLIAIGYDEICWNDDFEYTPRESFKNSKFLVQPNLKYQNWLVHEFQTSIPTKAIEIVKEPAEFGDEESNDPFCKWLIENDA